MKRQSSGLGNAFREIVHEFFLCPMGCDASQWHSSLLGWVSFVCGFTLYCVATSVFGGEPEAMPTKLEQSGVEFVSPPIMEWLLFFLLCYCSLFGALVPN